MPLDLKPAAIYFSKPEFREELCQELDHTIHIIHDMIFSTQLKPNLCFASDIWFEPQIVSFQSISEAVRILKQAGKFWYLHPTECVRRSKLIEEQLRKLPNLNSPFPMPSELPSIGGFTLLDQHTLLYSKKRLNPWPDGKCLFIEDKINPPNRAYLKLWEALTYLKRLPAPGDRVLDLGASPGGWSYVMHTLGAHVTSVDKAPLADTVAKLPNIRYLQQSAFALEPKKLDQYYEWILSDVACYPDRAYALIMKWLESGHPFKQLIFTIKLQGKTDFKALEKFQSIPNSRVVNLYYNKHEVTFFYPG